MTSRDTKIRGIAVEIRQTKLPQPFVSGSVTVGAVHDVFVGVVDGDGSVGLGYATAFTRDRAELLAAAVKIVRQRMGDISATGWRRISDLSDNEHRVDDVGAGTLFETALGLVQLAALESDAVRQGLPVAAVVGNTGTAPYYVSGGSLDAGREDLAQLFQSAASQGAKLVKIKIPDTAAGSMARIEDASSVLPEGLTLAVDANQTLDVSSAGELIDQLAKTNTRLAWFEEPIDARDYSGLAELRRRHPVRPPIAAGEVVFGERNLTRLIDEEACDVLILNPTRSGGPSRLLDLDARARQRDMPVIGHVHPQLGAHLLSSPGGPATVEYLGWWASYFAPGSYRQAEGVITADPSTPGFGFDPNLRSKLAAELVKI